MTRMTTEYAKTAALDVLRRTGEFMPASKVAAEIGCSPSKLTGNTGAVLFLLEEEGLVTRIGRKRGTLWRAAVSSSASMASSSRSAR